MEENSSCGIPSMELNRTRVGRNIIIIIRTRIAFTITIYCNVELYQQLRRESTKFRKAQDEMFGGHLKSSFKIYELWISELQTSS